LNGAEDCPVATWGLHLRTYAVEAMLVGLITALLILHVDRPLALHLSQGVATLPQAVSAFIPRLGRSEYYLALALPAALTGLWLIRRGRAVAADRRAREEGSLGWRLLQAGMLITGTLGVGHLLVFLLKQSLARLRPGELIRHGGYGFADPFSGEPFTSLPSSHCFTAFAMAAVLSRLAPPLRAVFFSAALLVAVQRLLAQQHFLSDVFVSLFLALMVSDAVQSAWRAAAPGLARRLSPRTEYRP
jgi:membrane-associated phospholipid phosphatase